MIHEIDPLTDPRWPALLQGHPSASVFHSREWLEALSRTYGYRASVLTTSEPGSELTNGLVFCRSNSWLVGRRLVSVPFSDHCEPLAGDPEELSGLFAGLEELAQGERCKYAELRPAAVPRQVAANWSLSQEYYLHRLDLRSGADAVFRRFHRDCIQRRIRHAEKAGIEVREGRDADTLAAFYDLVIETRRRHGLPPQPLAWFRSILECLGEAATIRCALAGSRPIAAILTLRHKTTLYYKYGASDSRFHKFGAMPYLFWLAIRNAIESGLEQLDMGRSDCDQSGLLTFKDRWSATRTILSYWRSPSSARVSAHPRSRLDLWARTTCRHMPDRCLIVLGELSYRHAD